MLRLSALTTLALTLLTGCATTIMPGEVGVPRAFGKLGDNVRGSGLVVHGPIGMTYERVDVRSQNLEVELDLPSKEGLNVRASVSILFRVEPAMAPDLLRKVGPNYRQALILPVFRSAAADVSARFEAKDMHSGERHTIEQQIAERMTPTLAVKGLTVEAVLMKSILLPEGLYASIEAKLAAEQSAQRMQYVLQEERQEAERRRVEAEGIRDAQRILEEGLSDQVLAWRSLETFLELSKSPNAKVIFTDGSLPMLIDPTDDATPRPARP